MNEAYRLNRAVQLLEDGIHAAADSYLRDPLQAVFTVNAAIPGWKFEEFVSELQRETNDLTGLTPFDALDPRQRLTALDTLREAVKRFVEGVLLIRFARLRRAGSQAQENRKRLLADVELVQQEFKRISVPKPRPGFFQRLRKGGVR